MALHGENLTRAAEVFMIWREGSSVDWHCTVEEIAHATQIDPKRVRAVCKRKGWLTDKKDEVAGVPDIE